MNQLSANLPVRLDPEDAEFLRLFWPEGHVISRELFYHPRVLELKASGLISDEYHYRGFLVRLTPDGRQAAGVYVH